MRLSDDPEQAAKWHPDDVGKSTQNFTGKMCLEAVQILSDAYHNLDQQYEYMYKPYSPTNGLAQWAAESYENFMYVLELAEALNKEYMRRTNKTSPHGAWETGSNFIPTKYIFPQVEATAQPQFFNGHEHLRSDDVVEGYRLYFANVKAPNSRWVAGHRPEWIDDYQDPEFIVEPEEEPNESSNNNEDDTADTGLMSFKT